MKGRVSEMSNKAYMGIGMNGFIAKWYAKITLKSFDEYVELASRIKSINSGKKDILEIAPGPGYLSIELRKNPDFAVTAIDISETFVEIGKNNAKDANVDVDFVVGNVSAMPFKDSQFDFIVCRAAFKNFSEPLKAINEIYRVLKPEGRALIIDLRRDITDKEIIAEVDQLNLSGWDKMMTIWTFKHMLIKRAYSTAQMKHLCEESKFEKYNIENISTGFDLLLTKI